MEGASIHCNGCGSPDGVAPSTADSTYERPSVRPTSKFLPHRPNFFSLDGHFTNEICPNPLLSKPITTVASGILSGVHRYFMSCISQDIGYHGPISRLLGELLAKRCQRHGEISQWLLATAENATVRSTRPILTNLIAM